MQQDYAHCQQLAIRIMGTRRVNGFGKGSYKLLNANDDPLACVCLTELLMGLIERGRKQNG